MAGVRSDQYITAVRNVSLERDVTLYSFNTAMSQGPDTRNCKLLTNIFPKKKGHKIRNNLEKYVHTLQIGPSQVVKIELSFKRQTYVLGKHQFIIREQNYASSILFSLSLSVSLSLLSNVTTTSGFSKYTSVKREGRYEGGGKLSGKRGS